MTVLEKTDKLHWRKFINSEPGLRGMLYLRERVPSCQEGDATKVIFNAGRVEGYRQAIDMISEVLSLEEPKQDNSENP